MLEPPNLTNEQSIAHLHAAYRLAVSEVAFLPLGADPTAAVYRVTATDATLYFLKLQHGSLPNATVAVADWLVYAGMQHLIAPKC